MNVKNKIALAIGEFPARALEWPLFLVQALGGLWILLPYYVRSPNAELVGGVGSRAAFLTYGAVLVIVGVVGLIGLIKTNYKHSLNLRRYASFAAFILFLYFTFLRLLINGIDNLGWLSYFLNASMCAAIYLRLRWEMM